MTPKCAENLCKNCSKIGPKNTPKIFPKILPKMGPRGNPKPRPENESILGSEGFHYQMEGQGTWVTEGTKDKVKLEVRGRRAPRLLVSQNPLLCHSSHGF